MTPENLQDIYELSPLQQGMLLHTLLAPSAGAYFEQLCFTISGDLDTACFRRAWQRVIDRHAALRTCFQWEDLERPYQIVCASVDAEWHIADWRDTGRGIAEDLKDWLKEDRARSFDLSSAPLLRFALLQTAKQSYEFVWSLHHILIDGWSWPPLLKEVFAFYEAERVGSQIDLPMPRRFRDFIDWLHEQDVAAAERYWRAALRGFTHPTSFRVEKNSARPRATSSNFERASALVPEAATANIRSFCRKHQLTISTVVQSAWAGVLSTYSGEPDVVFGSVVSGRPAALDGFETMIGMFINTIPTRIKFQQAESVLDLLRRVQVDHMDARQFEYSSLAEVQTWSELPRAVPLFESVLAYENFPRPNGERIGTTGLAISNLRAFPQINYPLTAIVSPGDALLLEIIYDADRFDDSTVARMLEHFRTAIEAMVADETADPIHLSVLSQTEQQILDGWNQTEGHHPPELLHQIFEAHAANTPEKEAITFGAQRLSYQELNARANRLAHHLRRQGVGPDNVVAVCLERSIDAIAALLAIMKAGGAYLPLDPTYPKDRLAYMLEDSGAAVLVTKSNWAAGLPLPAKTVYLDRISEDLATEPSTNPECCATRDNLIYVIYTSGSTGKPKGAAILHRGIANLAEAEFQTFGLSCEDRVLQFASLSFDASILEISLAFKSGGTLCIANQEQVLSSIALKELLRDQRITTFLLPPSLLASMSGDDLPHLRVPAAGGEPCTPEVVSNWGKGRRFLNLYGPTEATIWVTSFECQADGTRPPIGRPALNTKLYVLDRNLQRVPIGVPGELHISGEGLARGYLNHPELTRERFITNPFQPRSRMYKTGDLVRWRPDGNLEYLGRVDHQVKVHGFRIELEEVESCLASCPGVAAAAAAVRETGADDKALVAYVVLAHPAATDVSFIKHFVREHLPHYMVPARIVALPSLPLTPNGKIDRNALPSPGESTPESSSYVPVASAAEQKISAVWKEVLGVERVGRNDNFFDLGGHSLLLTRVHGRLKHELGLDFPIVDLFAYPTVCALAEHLYEPEPAETQNAANAQQSAQRELVAVIGMAGVFPGASNVEELWKNLRDGIEAVRFFSRDEAIAAGADPDQVDDPNYVKAGAVLDGADMFDARYFGMAPREAELTDPQHRVFLECAHRALENAGYDPKTYQGRIGVFAGASMSSYLLHNLHGNPEVIGAVGSYQAIISNDKDFVPSRVSYKLNLKGPAVNVQTACSTSLVAVHMARQALLNGECEVALAGGVSINAQQGAGYIYQAEGIASPDGHCRPFDAHAQGTVPGNGAALVVLKRLSTAIADGDHIEAVILGSAINNDGSQKVGYTAPSVEGQERVIRMAHADAGIDPASITYIETHGTGTILGDPIEIAALKRAFGGLTADGARCALGSVKGNLGHLDAAAGVTGLIKAVLSLKHNELPPAVNFQTPNPKLGIKSNPFYVNSELTAWNATFPLRAGVSSFGIGGTNAHVIVEGPPSREAIPDANGPQILTLSASTPSAVGKSAELLADFIERSPDTKLADIAFTLHVGRTAHTHRRAMLCDSREAAIRELRQVSSRNAWSGAEERRREVAFMFPGQGAQFPNMGRDLYESQPTFRAIVDECGERLKAEIDLDLRNVLYPAAENEQKAAETLRNTAFTQPALFVIEYALAKLWMSWGIVPRAMIGHSIGEYVAACLAGVFTLPDVLKLVAARGRILQDLPQGAMLSVPLSGEQLAELLPDEVSIAAVNAPSLTVVSGPTTAVERLADTLRHRGLEARLLRTSHAFHSKMMDPAVAPFEQLVRAVKKSAPNIPYISNVTGTWCTAEQATDERYWSAHLRKTVLFADGIKTLLAEPDRVLLEIGPGHSLSSLARQHPAKAPNQLVITSLMTGASDSAAGQVYAALARLWAAGVQPDWHAFHSAETRRRVALPTYPFERERYWISPRKPATAETKKISKNKDVSLWSYAPAWTQDVPFALLELKTLDRALLLLPNHEGVGECVANILRSRGTDVITATPGDAYQECGNEFTIRPAVPADYQRMIESLVNANRKPMLVAHLWLSDAAGSDVRADQRFDRAQERGFYSICHAVNALRNCACEASLVIVTNGVEQVWGTEDILPERATAKASVLVVKQEMPLLDCRSVDLDLEHTNLSMAAQQLAADLCAAKPGRMVAHRSGHRWTLRYVHAPLAAQKTSRIREGGTYLVTGGLGKIGLAVAEWLARKSQARIALVSRTPVPEKDLWNSWLAEHGAQDATSILIRRLQAIENAGSEVFTFAADVGDPEQMRAAVDATVRRFATLSGVFHAAGAVHESAFAEVAHMTREIGDQQFRPKSRGLIALDEAIAPYKPDFCVLFSSLSTVLGGIGYYGYTAANLFMDAFASQRCGSDTTQWMSIAWDAWRFESDTAAGSLAGLAIRPDEGIEVLERCLSAASVPRLIISTADLDLRIARALDFAVEKEPVLAEAAHERPALAIAYEGPRDELDRKILAIWQKLLGIKELGIRDNFFDLGGHSLLLTQMRAELLRDLQCEVAMTDLFRYPTIASLAEFIASRNTAPETLKHVPLRADFRRDSLRRQQQLRSAAAKSATAD